MKELIPEHKQTLDELLKKGEYIFSKKNKNRLLKFVYIAKSNLYFGKLEDEGFDVWPYKSKTLKLYLIDKYRKK